MENPKLPNISLVDNTSPTRQPSIDDSLSQTTSTGGVSRHFSKRWTRDERARRKYAKWQPQKLGIPDGASPPPKRSSPAYESPAYGSDVESTTDRTLSRTLSTRDTRLEETDTVDFAANRGSVSGNAHASGNSSNGNLSGLGNGNGDGNGTRNGNETDGTGDGQPADQDTHITPTKVLDILYENQRGWFFFGIPLYSHGSLLNFDPSAWVTKDLKDSPVNITNAQLPDPSWEWVWPTWYVDMSGDVDEQGWQYSLSFSSSAWHGSHPWFHSFVRRRRWVRLRNKKAVERVRRDQTKLEQAHKLTEDYFTIHSNTGRTARASEVGSQGASTFLRRASTRVERVDTLEEIADIPTLMHALRIAIVDREKIDALKRFIVDGGEELYYLDEKVCIPLNTLVPIANNYRCLMSWLCLSSRPHDGNS